MDNVITPLVTILMGLIGVAILATLVSRKADTANVINAGSKSFSQMLEVAMSPIMGGNYTNTNF